MPHINQTANEKELENAKRIIQINSAVNQAILKATTINELFNKICKAVIENTLLGISLDKNKSQYRDFIKIKWLSNSEGYLSSFENHHYFNDQVLMDSSLSVTIQTNQYFCSNNIETDLRLTQWADIILEKGYKSLFALPVIVESKLIVVINLFSRDVNYFTESEINWFLQLKDNIVFSINAINLTRLNSELELQNSTLLEKCTQNENDIDNFAYVLSHYIRKHVVNIIGLNRLFLKEKIDSKSRHLLDHISQEVKNLDTVIKEVSTILNFRSNSSEDKIVINLEELLQEIMHEEHSFLEINKAQIIYNFSNINEAETNRNSLKKIFTKFIHNAIRFTQTNTIPNIEIRSELSNGFIHIHFKDYGIGIDLKRRQYDFFKNFSLNQSGKGFGLLLIKKHLDNINGKIEVKSVLDKWTEFIIYLPLVNKN